jgi:hypothetical protein
LYGGKRLLSSFQISFTAYVSSLGRGFSRVRRLTLDLLKDQAELTDSADRLGTRLLAEHTGTSIEHLVNETL